MSDGLLLRKNALWPLAKRVLEPLGLMAEASATDATIQKKKKLDWVWLYNNLKRRNGRYLENI